MSAAARSRPGGGGSVNEMRANDSSPPTILQAADTASAYTRLVDALGNRVGGWES